MTVPVDFLAVRTDWFAPRYVVKVGGTRLKSDVTDLIETVEYEEAENVASKITLTVNNPRFVLSGFKGFAEGNEIDLWMGYVGGKLAFQNRGTIVRPNPTFPRRGTPRLTVVAHGAENKLFKSDGKGRVFRKMTDSEIARKVLGEVGIATFSFDTKRRVTRWRKKGTSNWEFVQRIARLNGFELTVRYEPADGLHRAYFGPPDESGESQEERYRFVYGSGEGDATLFDFYPNFSLPSQTTSVEVAFTDPKSRKTHRLTAEVTKKEAEKTKFSGPSGKRRLRRSVRNGPTVKLTVFGQTEEVVADRPFRSAADAKRFAAAWFARRQKDFVFARGTLLGTPTVRKRQVHDFVLPDDRFSGEWVFTSVIQIQNASGLYETAFTATKRVLGSAVGAPGNFSGTKLEAVEV